MELVPRPTAKINAHETSSLLTTSRGRAGWQIAWCPWSGSFCPPPLLPSDRGIHIMTFATHVLFCILASYLECGMWMLHVYAALLHSPSGKRRSARGREKVNKHVTPIQSGSFQFLQRRDEHPFENMELIYPWGLIWEIHMRLSKNFGDLSFAEKVIAPELMRNGINPSRLP